MLMANAAMASSIRRSRRRRLESYNKTLVGFVVLITVGVLVAASLLVKQLGIGYAHYTAEFLQAASLQIGRAHV